MSEITFPETLTQAVTFFADEDNAFAFMRGIRWADGVATCPNCASAESYFLAKRRTWKCRDCSKQYSIKQGTIFEDSPIKLGKWICAFWMIVNAKNGISSYELHRGLGVTQKTAWFMLHRIRLAIQEGTIVKDKMKGTVEVDESWIGGKARYMNAKTKKRNNVTRKGVWGKTPVMGLLEHGTRKKASRVRAEVIVAADKPILDANVRKYVLKGATVHTDEHKGYADLSDEYVHGVVNHAVSYAQEGVHTNGMENFWSLLKRTLKGTYVSVEPFHLFRYLSEQCFRFNERKNPDGDQGRFLTAIAGIVGKRLTYKGLIGCNPGLPGEETLCAG